MSDILMFPKDEGPDRLDVVRFNREVLGVETVYLTPAQAVDLYGGGGDDARLMCFPEDSVHASRDLKVVRYCAGEHMVPLEFIAELRGICFPVSRDGSHLN